MDTRSPGFASDELLTRLDGLLADLRALRAEVHGISAGESDGEGDGNGDAAPSSDATKAKKKRKKNSKKTKDSKQSKHKKKASAA